MREPAHGDIRSLGAARPEVYPIGYTWSGRRRARARRFLALLLLTPLLLVTPVHGQAPPNEYQLVYDALGRLVGVITPSGDVAEYVYDAVGNLLAIRRRTVADLSLLTFTPLSGPVGTAVTLTGTGFGPTPPENAVSFNGVPAIVTEAAPTRLVALVPLAAATGPIAVATAAGAVTSSRPFAVPPPLIAGFTPPSAAAGTAVTIQGSGFVPEASLNTVLFSARDAGNSPTLLPATVTAATATTLAVVGPSRAVTGPIRVTTPAGTSTSAVQFVVPEPTVTGFSPASGSVGSEMTLTGTGFGVGPDGTRVYFTEERDPGVQFVQAVVTGGTATEVVAMVPGAAITGRLLIDTAAGAVLTTETFIVLPPVITTVAPAATSAGIPVTITGNGFSPLAGLNTVTFNGVAASVASATPTALVATVPAGATTGPVAVTNRRGTATSPAPFTVLPSLGFTPDSGPVGTEVVITGEAFSPVPAENTVTFGGRLATVSAATPTELAVTVPVNAATGPIVVVSPGGSSTSATPFLVIPGPEILTFDPILGPVGTAVTIHGQGFGATPGENTVTFNGVPATVTFAHANQLLATVPDGATTGPIVVTTAGGTATGPFDFTVTVGLAFVPPGAAVGMPVIITGTGFFSFAPEDTTVTFNGVPAVFTVVTDTELIADVPAGATTGPIVVTTPEGTQTSATAFEVRPAAPPTITGFNPPSGEVADLITITGTGFAVVPNRNTVEFDGGPSPAFVRTATDTQLTVHVPCFASPAGPITVTTDLGSVVSTQQFTFTGGFCD